VTFERFSDSAGAYIKLDSNNPSVYKQLYRAAKAKLKLRIRASIHTNPLPGPIAPEPILLETNHLTGQAYVPPSVHTSPCIEIQHQAYTYNSIPLPSVTLPSSETEKISDTMAKDEIKKGADDEAPVPRFFSAREQFYAELMASKDSKGMLSSIAQPFAAPGTSFTICCNNCNFAIANAHYHCSKCDDGDYDLCEACYDRQIRCNGDDHWLVKRYVKDGKVTSSSTETVAPKKSTTSEVRKEVPGAFTAETKEALCELMDMSRTCNSCVGGTISHRASPTEMLTKPVFDENNFVTCTVCEDFDLCLPCHVGLKHGHHPGHAFMPASEETTLNTSASKLLAPGRNVPHAAVCDGCDKVCRSDFSKLYMLISSRPSTASVISA